MRMLPADLPRRPRLPDLTDRPSLGRRWSATQCSIPPVVILFVHRGSCDMRLPTAFPLGLAGLLFLTHQVALAEEPAAIVGQPLSLVVQPQMIRLFSSRAMQQILVTGRYGDGTERDLTALCVLRAEAADVV